MLIARQLILAALATLVFFGTNTAQTANEMRQKYGSPDDKGHYLVRPEIGMSASFAAYAWIERNGAESISPD